MILPIITYGDSVLRKKTIKIHKMTDELNKFIDDMFETLNNADGVGLSANQVNVSIDLFIVNIKIEDDELNEVFINPTITDYSDDKSYYKEGCLSFPHLQEEVQRSNKITIEYLDRNFNHHRKEFDGLIARVIQHEYDHTKGIVFIDKINPIKRKMIAGRVKDIINRKVHTNYKIK